MIDTSKLLPGDILVEISNGLLGFLMGLFHQRAQHVLLVDNDTRYAWESNIPLVRKSEINIKGPYIVIRTDCSPETIQRALEWARSCEGKISYGYVNVAILALMMLLGIEKRPWKDVEWRSSMQCAEFVSEAFDRGGDDIFPDYEDQDIRPDHYLTNPRGRDVTRNIQIS